MPRIDARGGIVGAAELVACVRHASAPCLCGLLGFVLRQATPALFLPLRGRLGLFQVEMAQAVPTAWE